MHVRSHAIIEKAFVRTGVLIMIYEGQKEVEGGRE